MALFLREWFLNEQVCAYVPAALAVLVFLLAASSIAKSIKSILN
jgi:hypothetical protein